jgi:hypothetical protein
MKRMNKVIASLVGAAVLAGAIAATFVLVGTSPASAPHTDVNAVAAAATTAGTTVGTPEVVMSADFAVGYSSIAQLEQAADLVVRGEVTAVSYLDFNTAAYTKVTLKVTKCLKGSVAEGDQITILEVGGMTTMAAVKGDKFGPTTKEDAETKVKVTLEGAPLTQVGEESLYFLGQGKIGVVSDTYYVPLGAYQGHFKVDRSVAKRFVPADASAKYTSLAIDETAIDATVTRAAVQ